jgi:hypothetical protein
MGASSEDALPVELRNAFERGGEQLRVLAEQHDVAHLAAERVGER